MIHIKEQNLKCCGCCKKYKTKDNFWRDIHTNSRLACYCKLCGKKRKQDSKTRYKEKTAKTKAIYGQKHRKELSLKAKAYYLKNKDKLKEYQKNYDRKNAEKIANRKKLYAIENRDKINQLAKKYRKIPKMKLNHSISTLIRKSLKKNKGGYHWESLVGYTLKDLVKCLERQFRYGMNWDNYGEWHIDHIIPISVFNFEKPKDIDFKRCWSLKNLQPMWKKDNIRKKDKLYKHFQPSFQF